MNNKKVMIFIILTFVFLFNISSYIISQANELQRIYVGDFEIRFDRLFQSDTDDDGIIDKVSYFHDNNLVLTIWDNNQDGLPNLCFVYDEEEYLILQAEDLNSDGKPDEFSNFNREEQVFKK